MNRKLKLFLSISIAIVSLLPLAAQNNADSNFELITENRELAKFNGINATGRFKIVLVESNAQYVSVAAPDKLIEAVETKVESGVLYINMRDLTKEKDGNILDNLKTKYNDYLIRQPIEVKIGTSNLSILSAKGSTRFESEGTLNSNDLIIELSGASKAELNYNIANSLNASLTEATKIDIQGKAENIAVRANGACFFNGSKLLGKNVKVELNGASRAEVHASDSFDADLNGATKVICTGSPKSIKQAASRGSSVTVR